jgi:hypothetical protein
MIKTLALSPVRKILIFAFLALLFSLLVFYMFQINNLISGSYNLNVYQKNVDRLSAENEKLESNLVRAGSLERVEQKISELSFEKIDKIHYIQTLVAQVAAAN